MAKEIIGSSPTTNEVLVRDTNTGEQKWERTSPEQAQAEAARIESQESMVGQERILPDSGDSFTHETSPTTEQLRALGTESTYTGPIAGESKLPQSKDDDFTTETAPTRAQLEALGTADTFKGKTAEDKAIERASKVLSGEISRIDGKDVYVPPESGVKVIGGRDVYVPPTASQQDTILKGMEAAQNKLKPYTSDEGVDVANAIEKGVSKDTLKVAGIPAASIEQAEQYLADKKAGKFTEAEVEKDKLFAELQARMAPVKVGPFSVAAENEQNVRLGIGLIPVAGTVVLWNDMTPVERTVSIALDVLVIGAPLGVFGKAFQFARQVGRIKGAAKLETTVKDAARANVKLLRDVNPKLVKPLKDVNKAQEAYVSNKISVRDLEKTLASTKGEVRPEIERGLDLARQKMAASRAKLANKVEKYADAQLPGDKGFNDRMVTQFNKDLPKRVLDRTDATIESVLSPKVRGGVDAQELTRQLNRLQDNIDQLKAATRIGKEMERVPKGKYQSVLELKAARAEEKLLKARIAREIKKFDIEAPKGVTPGARGGVKTITPATTVRETGLVTASGRRIKLGKGAVGAVAGAVAGASTVKKVKPSEYTEAVGKELPAPFKKGEPGKRGAPEIAPRVKDKPGIRPGDRPSIGPGDKPGEGEKPDDTIKEAQQVKPSERIKEGETVKPREDVVPKPAPAPKSAPKTDTPIKTRIDSALKQRTPPKRVLILRGKAEEDEQSKRQRIADAESAVGFRMGKLGKDRDVFHVALAPYASNEDVVTVLGKAPQGVPIVEGAGSAKKTARVLTGRKAPKRPVGLDVGFMDANITPAGKEKINVKFTPDPQGITTHPLSIGSRRVNLPTSRKIRITPKRPRIGR